MKEATRVDPYDPVSAITGGLGVQWFDLPAGMPAGYLILPADPHRLWFSVVQNAATFDIAPWTDTGQVGWPILDVASTQPWIFHTASYPGMVTLAWYNVSTLHTTDSPARVVFYRTAG